MVEIEFLSKEDVVATLVCSEVVFRLTATKLTLDALDDVDGNNFCHDDMSF